MNDLEAIGVRCSRRAYTLEAIKEDLFSIEKYNKESGLNICFLQDGSSAFSKMKNSYGMFKNVKSLFILKGNGENLKEKCGYYGEKIVLESTKQGLGTCWVGGTFDREDKIFMPYKDEEIIAVITVGYALKNKSFKEKVISTMVSRKTKSIEELYSFDKTPPQWFFEGAKALQKAPTALNSQKVSVKYENDIVTANVADDYPADKIDLGICKLHFEIGAQGKFALGNNAVFTKI